jgi:SAM-dependent MidA family methyltransferase
MSEMEPFSAFMARALHDPRNGYYARHIRTVGARGDFSTSATLSSLLGQAIARWLLEEARLQPEVRHVIEVGPGDGTLAATVRAALGWWQRRRFRFHLVETSPVLRKRQEDRLGAAVSWHQDLKEALELAEGGAFIYHNELLDAFPVTLAEWRDGNWQEVWVGQEENGHWQEALRPLQLPAQQFSALQGWQPREGQRIELHDSVRQWMNGWVPHWRQGSMLTVDYGDVFPALYHRRPRGTLRAFLLQQRLEGREIYQNVGRQDMTADVNFTDYRAWARDLGWTETGYGTQAELIRARAAKPSGSPADAFVVNAEGAGGAFKFVTHRKLRR